MPEPITITPQSVPDGTCIPGTAQGIINLSAQYLSATFQNGEFSLWNFGSNTPDPELQDRPWYRTTTDGKPLGPYSFYNGAWVRQGPFPVGFIAMYSGAGAGSAYFDGTGKGISGTEGEGWAICFGQNGTPDLRNKFVIEGYTYSPGSTILGVTTPAGWISNIDNVAGQTTGGAINVTLVRANIPPLTATIPRGSNDPGSSNSFLYGATSQGNSIQANVKEDDANPFRIIPPYYALGFLRWNPYI